MNAHKKSARGRLSVREIVLGGFALSDFSFLGEDLESCQAGEHDGSHPVGRGRGTASGGGDTGGVTIEGHWAGMWSLSTSLPRCWAVERDRIDGFDVC